tara:strand:- start:889 stop:1113 length:225 start_codon:yes stop_codon:yes gene_type:complete
MTESLTCGQLSFGSNGMESPMSMESHLVELKKKHENLEHRLEAEERSPAADRLAISQMKKKKLQLKDEIQRLSH